MDPGNFSLQDVKSYYDLVKVEPSFISSFSEDQMTSLIYYWREILKSQRNVVDCSSDRLLVVGDIHGDFTQLKKAIMLLESKQVDKLVFNGDLIDRGADMLECLITVITKQINEPEKIYYLRGNHEFSSVNAFYGFRGHATAIYGSRIYDYFTLAFQQLPFCMKLNNRIFITHGGVPKEQIFFHLMRLELKPREPNKGSYYELIWNDPDPNIDYYSPSHRGNNIFKFGKKAFDEFMEFHNLKLFIRAHQVFEKGYNWFFDNKLLSIFSSSIGPYHNVKPHFALVKNNEIELIPANSIEI